MVNSSTQEILQSSWKCPTLFLLERKEDGYKAICLKGIPKEMHPELGAEENGKRERQLGRYLHYSITGERGRISWEHEYSTFLKGMISSGFVWASMFLMNTIWAKSQEDTMGKGMFSCICKNVKDNLYPKGPLWLYKYNMQFLEQIKHK